MGLLNGVISKLKTGGIGGAANASAGTRDVLTMEDFEVVNTELKAGQWNNVLVHTVGVNHIRKAGFGSKNFPEQAGYIYVYLAKSDGTQILGKMRMIATDPTDMGIEPLFAEDLDSLAGDLNDKAKMTMFEETGASSIVEKEKILIKIKPTADVTYDPTHANSKLKIPSTLRYASKK